MTHHLPISMPDSCRLLERIIDSGFSPDFENLSTLAENYNALVEIGKNIYVPAPGTKIGPYLVNQGKYGDNDRHLIDTQRNKPNAKLSNEECKELLIMLMKIEAMRGRGSGAFGPVRYLYSRIMKGNSPETSYALRR